MDKHGFDNDKCLSLDVMRLYHERKLSDRKMHQVEKHLLDCELCSDVLEGLEVQDIPVINSIAANVNRKIAAVAGMQPQPLAQPSFLGRFKWYFIVPAAVVIGWLAWNRMNSDSHEVAEVPAIAGNQPVLTEKQPPVSVKKDPPVNTIPVLREPQAVEKSVPSPVSEAPSEKKKPEANTEPTVTADNTPEEPGAKLPEKAENTLPPEAEEKPGNSNNNNNTNKVNPPEIDHAPLRLVEVKVINKVAAVSGSKRSSGGGQLGGSKAGKVDDGMQPHEMPVFYGGDEAMKVWLIRNFQNPVKDKSSLKGKTTAVIFDVSSKGKIDNIEVTKSLSKELDAEVIRLVENMPQWKAASKKGSITVVLAITFK